MLSRHRLILAFLLLIAGTTSLRADILTTNPLLPPPEGQYVSPQDAHVLYQAGLLSVELQQTRHYGWDFSTPPPFIIGDSKDEHFNSHLQGLVVVNGGPANPYSATAIVQVLVTKIGGPNGSPLGTYSTEMLQLDVSGLPGGALVRESPTLASLGQTDITDAGGGLFRISSFFDIFTELSVDGGQTWIPSTGSTHVDLVPLVPEPSSLAMSGLAFVILASWRRRMSRR